ncbi:type II toxin-antitoxin system YhaV family toxin [Mycoplana sp. MJR14]|uniref:type II toxin-antitoxin system YhaV family toxin n=1 Tax=Mycoplana sp. MJR14 TaxID=3032583 RepID=UPI0023DA07D9|nr:type II toxin-antitoxin system YhaV family toxin [Mycoplana sp. MJR14]MDF1632018.1 type II toxin-antitoxin system YhaV family toxin [Mycoplana sp. MJR14]
MTDHKINGWTLYLHPLFASALRQMIEDVRRAKAADPVNYRNKRAAKLLAATRKMAFEDIPANPADPKFRQGDTLGERYKHWFRGKYLQQYRLFFRYHETQRIIVLAWLNDETSKRAYGSRTDAYAVFAKMLKNGNPPDDWPGLLAAIRDDGVSEEDVRSLTGP